MKTLVRDRRVVVPGRSSSLRRRAPSSSLLALFLLGAAGCSETPEPPVATDEAMKRASVEGKSVEQAARDYFYPRKIVDYFPGMDVVSVAARPEDETPGPLLDV